MKWWTYWWTPIIVIYNVVFAWMSIKNSQDKGWGWFWINFFFMLLAPWALISKVTPKEQMVFVALVYDVLILLGFQIGMVLFGATKGFNAWNWAGMGIVTAGFIVFKLGDIYH
jgi:uncharacterized membrane protein